MNDTVLPDTSIETLSDALRRLTEAGAPLPPERELASRFQVSRHKLRRAIATVRAEGVLPKTSPGRAPRRRGETLVGNTSPLEVIEVRLMLEPALAEYAALRASPQEIERIRRAALPQPCVETGVADIAFHTAVAAGAHNVLATDLYVLLRQVGTDARLRVGRPLVLSPEHVRRRDDEHVKIAQAIAARDPTRAHAAMLEHLLSVETQVRRRVPAKGRKE